MAVPLVNETTPLEKPLSPETSFAAQVLDTQPSTEEASTQVTGDKPTDVAAAQETTKKTEECALEQTAGSLPVAAADFPVTEESVPSAEAPVSLSVGLYAHEGAAQEVQSQAFVVSAEAPASQGIQHISAEAKSIGEGEETSDDPNPPEFCAASVDKKADGALKIEVEDQRNLCLDAGCKEPEVLPGDVNDDVATQNESLEEKEPIMRLSKAIQSKGTSKSEGLLSTWHLSGGFSWKSWNFQLPHPKSFTLLQCTLILQCETIGSDMEWPC